PSGLHTQDGKLWFSTVKGLVRVDPALLNEHGAAPSVVLEDLLLDGKSMPPAPAGANTSMKAGPRRLEFRYTALRLAAPERVRFKYKLEGLEDSWTDAGNNRAAQYSALPPGDYRFRVTARSPEGVWNEEGVAFALTILPRFWQTWWFAAVIVALVLA